MHVTARPVRIPLVTLHQLLGGSSVMAPTAGFRPNKVDRRWPCGCVAAHHYDRLEDAAWVPCPVHAPAD